VVAAILSPHLDDAVLSCWHLLARPGEVLVINVFTGAPAGAGTPAWWDRLTGANDSGQRVRERVEEDRQALARAGRTPINLGFLDEQYREADQPSPSVAERIRAELLPGAHIYAPAALGGHPDHALVRAAGLELRRAQFAMSLYADLPHATLHGWPAWVTGTGTPGSRDLATALWDRSLTETGFPAASMTRTVHELDAEAHARKLAAIRAYRTQLHGLSQLAGRSLEDRETLGYEVVWTLPSPHRAHPRADAVA
jgi:LmbE family N-acetylglucosaminyl deacetylase